MSVFIRCDICKKKLDLSYEVVSLHISSGYKITVNGKDIPEVKSVCVKCATKVANFVENIAMAEQNNIIVNKELNVGDICVYGSENQGNGSVNIVGITELRDDVISKIKVLKVITDNSGNNYFKYLLETGKEMYASNKYLRKLEPKEIEDLQIGV